MTDANRSLIDDPEIAERTIVLHLLYDGHDVRWSLAELEREAFDVGPTALASALDRLRRHGVVVPCGPYVLASRCAEHPR